MLQLRLRMAQKRSKFRRPESWRYRRLAENWRRPKGVDNKVRLRRKGWQKMPDVGMRGPRLTRGLHPTGLTEVLIRNLRELDSCNPRSHAVRLAANLGARKKAAALKKARQLGLRVLNPKVKLTGRATT